MRVADCNLLNAYTVEFDVYIKSTGTDFILTSYQCALSFNPSLTDIGSLNFSYIQGSSQLINLPPLSGIGVLNQDGLCFLTFGSVSPLFPELISSAEKRIGRFRLINSKSFPGNITNIVWGLNGSANTILTGIGFSDITNRFNHINLLGSAAFPFSFSVENDWNLVSIPGFHPSDQNINTWWTYRDPLANVYNSSYQPVTDLEPGKGYWMKHSGSRIYNTGEEWPAEGFFYSPNYPIYAQPGWNLIGVYNYDVSASSITTIPADLQLGYIFKFASGGGYIPTSVLKPGYGYLIFLTSTGKVILPDSGYIETSKIISHYNSEWGKIIFMDSKDRSYTLFVNDETGSENYILPPVPNSEIFDIRFSSGKFAEDISSGIHPVELRGVEYPVQIIVENAIIRIQDETGSKLNVMLKSGEKVFINGDINNKILISNDKVPTEYSLSQNYPNPFNPSTTIEFSIPEEVDNVELTIFNSLGQKIAELINSELTPGRYSYKWDAGNESSGLYIYRLKTESANGGFTLTKKMILLK